MWHTTSASPSWYNGSGWVEATVTSSDKSIKTAPQDITDAECEAALKMKIVKFKMLESVEQKGIDDARWHYGVIAQDCLRILNEFGIPIETFGPIIRAPVIGEDGRVIKNIWQVRYHEMLMLKFEALKRLK